MSEYLATSPALDGEAPTVEGRLADIMETAVVTVNEYRLSETDKLKVIAALRTAAVLIEAGRRGYGRHIEAFAREIGVADELETAARRATPAAC